MAIRGYDNYAGEPRSSIWSSIGSVFNMSSYSNSTYSSHKVAMAAFVLLAALVIDGPLIIVFSLGFLVFSLSKLFRYVIYSDSFLPSYNRPIFARNFTPSFEPFHQHYSHSPRHYHHHSERSGTTAYRPSFHFNEPRFRAGSGRRMMQSIPGYFSNAATSIGDRFTAGTGGRALQSIQNSFSNAVSNSGRLFAGSGGRTLQSVQNYVSNAATSVGGRFTAGSGFRS